MILAGLLSSFVVALASCLAVCKAVASFPIARVQLFIFKMWCMSESETVGVPNYMLL